MKSELEALRKAMEKNNTRGAKGGDGGSGGGKDSKKKKKEEEEEGEGKEDKKGSGEGEEDEAEDDDGVSVRNLGLIFIGTVGVLAFLQWYSREDCVEIYYQQFVTDLLKQDLVEKLEVVNGERVRVYLRDRKSTRLNSSH